MSDIYSAWTTYGVPVSVGMMKSIGMDDEIPTYVQGKIVPPQRPADVDTIFNRARSLFDESNYDKALEHVIVAKATKIPWQGLDLLRAQCFIQLGQKVSAIEALREELRWFPTNLQAQELLNQLQSSLVTDPVKKEDTEFQGILQEIRPYTMLSEERLYSMFSLAKYVCERNIPGNFIECGVTAGGSSALLAYCHQALQ